MTIFEELKRRGLIAQMSHEEEIEKALNAGGVKFYIGFDATADSLHIGGLLQLITMRRLQLAGHYPIALLGTATSLIGDPTGKTDMRQMLTSEQIVANSECFARQMARVIDMSSGKAEIVRNGDWFADIKYIEFLRDVGKHFSVNKMLTAECFKSRLEKGLSFLEFNYMLLQSYDFLHLYRTMGVTMQCGGDDQWSNILSGADLIRRAAGGGESEHGIAYALTFSLLLTKDGKKMGKTEKGAVWLDSEKFSVYDFFQYFRNVNDADVFTTLKMLTFLPVEEIEALENDLAKEFTAAKINAAKELLAYEVTKIVHGEEEAVKARDAARSVFTANTADANMPTVTISTSELSEITEGEICIADLLVLTKQCSSKRDARTNIEQGGVSVDDAKVTDSAFMVKIDEFVVVKKGKKNFVKVILEK